MERRGSLLFPVPEDLRTTLFDHLELRFWKRSNDYQYKEMVALAAGIADQGVTVVEDVATILQEITNQAEKSRELISEVTVGSDGQVHTIGEMADAMTALDRATQSTAASAQQSAANAAEVLNMADRMRQVADELGALVGE